MKYLRITNLIIILLLLGTLQGFSQEPEFYEAAQYYKNGRYKEAITIYEAIIKDGKMSGPLYFNLGNSYFKDGQLGKAIINYKRAKRLLPRDGDLDFNYKYAITQIKYHPGERQTTLFKRVLHNYSNFFTLDELMKIILVMYLIVGTSLLMGLFLKWQGKRIIWLVALISFVLVVNSVIFVAKNSEYKSEAVIESTVESKFEPVDNATTHFSLSEGVMVNVLDEKDGWFKIQRSDRKVGWIKEEFLEKI